MPQSFKCDTFKAMLTQIYCISDSLVYLMYDVEWSNAVIGKCIMRFPISLKKLSGLVSW